MLMTHQPFVQAEIDYRLARAGEQYHHTTLEESGHRGPRRRSLHLPHPRRRPVRLA